MKIKTLFIILLFLSGCAEIPIANQAKSPFIFPESRYEDMGESSRLEEMKAATKTSDSQQLVNRLQELYPENISEELKDPFVVKRLPWVQFFSWKSGEEIARFYLKVFNDLGWKEVRGILNLEYTLARGDWVRVFKKKNQMVHVHIMGPMKDIPQDNLNEFSMRDIFLRFDGISPEELLGSDFKEWKKHPFEGDFRPTQ